MDESIADNIVLKMSTKLFEIFFLYWVRPVLLVMRASSQRTLFANANVLILWSYAVESTE